MITAIEQPDRLCILRWMGQVRLHVDALTACGVKLDAGKGVVQVPDYILQGRPVNSVSDFGGAGRRPLRVCDRCMAALMAGM